MLDLENKPDFLVDEKPSTSHYMEGTSPSPFVTLCTSVNNNIESRGIVKKLLDEITTAAVMLVNKSSVYTGEVREKFMIDVLKKLYSMENKIKNNNDVNIDMSTEIDSKRQHNPDQSEFNIKPGTSHDESEVKDLSQPSTSENEATSKISTTELDSRRQYDLDHSELNVKPGTSHDKSEDNVVSEPSKSENVAMSPISGLSSKKDLSESSISSPTSSGGKSESSISRPSTSGGISGTSISRPSTSGGIFKPSIASHDFVDEVNTMIDQDTSLIASPSPWDSAGPSLTTEEVTTRMRDVFTSGLEAHFTGEEMEACRAVSTPLYPHQKAALASMCRHENKQNDGMTGGILADDMGLGKTLTVIALILTNHWDKKPLAKPELGFTRKPLSARGNQINTKGKVGGAFKPKASAEALGVGTKTNVKKKTSAVSGLFGKFGRGDHGLEDKENKLRFTAKKNWCSKEMKNFIVDTSEDEDEIADSDEDDFVEPKIQVDNGLDRKQKENKFRFTGKKISSCKEKTGLQKTRVFLKKPNPLGFFGFYWVLLGFIGFFWVLLGFSLFAVFFAI